MEIFVFGSNMRGLHGAGAANYAAREKGAKYGQAEGLQGNSYAVPTKDKWLKALPLPIIEENVKRFLEFARANPQLKFYVTATGCGYSRYLPDQIAPFYKDRPSNVRLNEQFLNALAGGSETDLLHLFT